jgi:hypothetical protein
MIADVSAAYEVNLEPASILIYDAPGTEAGSYAR